METAELVRVLEEFLAEAERAVVVEAGEVVFDFASAKYSVSGQYGRCVLHLWSQERNAVRRVLAAQLKNAGLQLTVQRFGQAKPSKLEICRDRDRRTATARRASRAQYQQQLRGVLERNFAGWTIDRLTTEMDLERSFGPVYTRGVMRRGRSGFAVLGVGAQELQGPVDGALTFGILWLDLCRERLASACYMEGLRLFVPAGRSAMVRERMAHLDRGAAKWQLYELGERDGALLEIDTADRGNIQTRLARCPEPEAVLARFAASIESIRRLVPESECVVLAPHEISFRLHGLEFAQAQIMPEPGGFRRQEQIVFGAGASQTVLGDENAEQFRELLRRLAAIRRPDADRAHPLGRMAPERWLESLVRRDVRLIDDRLDPDFVYTQVPAFTASDRGMIDVLAVTREGRLAVLELKADEDIHLPLQGIDYWSRVCWHHQRREFQEHGYFQHPTAGRQPTPGASLPAPGRELAAPPPILLLVAPALHIHPATDTVLRYISPEIDITLAAVDERWREQLRVVFRKRAEERRHAGSHHLR